MRLGIAIAPGAGFALGFLIVGALTVGLGFWSGVAAFIGGGVGLVLGAYWAERATGQVRH